MVDPYPILYPGSDLGDLRRKIDSINDAIGTRAQGGKSLLEAVVAPTGTGLQEAVGLDQPTLGALARSLHQKLSAVETDIGGDDPNFGGGTRRSLHQKLSAVEETLTNDTIGLAVVVDQIDTRTTGFTIGEAVASMVTVLGAGPESASAPSLSHRFHHDLQARLAVKFVDDLVPLTIWWLVEHPASGHRRRRLLPLQSQHESKIVAPEQFFPRSFVQLHAIVPVGKHDPWHIFEEMLKICEAEGSLSDDTNVITDYWNEVRQFYGLSAKSDSIPTESHLTASVSQVYAIFEHLYKYLRNIPDDTGEKPSQGGR
jgi:hypothetical protein